MPELLRHPEHLPLCVRQAPVALRYLGLLAPLDWANFHEHDLDTDWGISPVPYVLFVAAHLIKLDQESACLPWLRRYLVEHPVLSATLNFPIPGCSCSLSATDVAVGDYYWGYASGVVATIIPDWAEIVLAEL
ncbi:MAG: hypothetical protein JXA14_23540, partial [Anaerolineae bacterium]|nr:hypothetical protein [Anaerolineae bacterium]